MAFDESTMLSPIKEQFDIENTIGVRKKVEFDPKTLEKKFLEKQNEEK